MTYALPRLQAYAKSKLTVQELAQQASDATASYTGAAKQAAEEVCTTPADGSTAGQALDHCSCSTYWAWTTVATGHISIGGCSEKQSVFDCTVLRCHLHEVACGCAVIATLQLAHGSKPVPKCGLSSVSQRKSLRPCPKF